jgi:hypothetical protein
MPDSIPFRNNVCRILSHLGTVSSGLHGGKALTYELLLVLFRLLSVQRRERDNMDDAAPPALHSHSVDRNLQEPSFGVKVCAACPAGGINGTQGSQKGVLSEVLALVPFSSQAIDHLKHQSAIIGNECLDRLSRRYGIDMHRVYLPLSSVLLADLTLLMEMHYG